MRFIILAAVGLLLTFMLSCAALQNVITPCYIDKEAGVYSGEEMTEFLPYTTLSDAERINREMGFVHELNQTQLVRLQEDDVRLKNHLSKNLTIYMKDAAEFRDNVFSPTSPVGMLAPAGLGLVLGWLGITKPGDLKRNEVEEV